MRNLLLKMWEIVFPERKHHQIVRLASESDMARALVISKDREITSLLDFNEPLVRAAIHEAKFHANEKAWRLLAYVLEKYLKHYNQEFLLIPIPLSSNRRLKRGYNQVSEVAKIALRQNPHIKIREDVLVRTRDTKPQTSLSKEQRLTNVMGAFGVVASKDIQGKNIVILDDVSTTGSTLMAARASLATHHPASIVLLSLSH